MSETLVNPNNYASLANYDDYGDTNDLNLLSGIKKTTLDRLGGHGHGHGGDYGHSTGSYDKKILCDPEGINETLLLLLIGGLIGGGILLLLKIKAAAGRSFQDEGILGSLMSGHLTERILVGLEDFEEKIDHMMGGMSDDNSWIGDLYNSINGVEQSTHSSDPSRINGEISNLNLGNEGESTF
uniref:Uncharacterized protein n=1 Tax=Lepeophtheirus salmonis TaxID=72036 RepID=A0A0K2UP30_LEPSM